MKKPNYSFEKRQRELAKKQKKADKEMQRKNGQPAEPPVTDVPAPDTAA